MKLLHCPHCGAINGPGLHLCSLCGKEINSNQLTNHPSDGLTISAKITIQEIDDSAPEIIMSLEEYPLVQIIEFPGCCPLCEYMDGMIIRRDSPDFDLYARPPHINCRRVWAYIGKDEIAPDGQPTRPDWTPPPQELIEKYGHFIKDPEKFKSLRVLSQPEGRDFIVNKFHREQIDPITGNVMSEIVTMIDWRIPHGDAPTGSECRLYCAKQEFVFLGKNELSLDEYTRAVNSGNSKLIELLIDSGFVFSACAGTRAMVMDKTIDKRKVRITDGNNAGLIGWVSYDPATWATSCPYDWEKAL